MRYIVCSLMVLALIVVSGCVKKGDGNTAVTGSVTQGGQPLEGAIVRFIPANSGGSGEDASGKTDENGKFVLTTSTGDIGSGTKPGSYKVTVSKTENKWDGKSYVASMRPDDTGEPQEPVKDVKVIQLLPDQYRIFAQTPFKAEVTTNKKTNVFEFAIP